MFIEFFKNNRLKIFFILIISFFVSYFLDNNFFIAHSPYFRNPINNIARKIDEMIYIAKFGEKGRKLIEASRFPAASTLKNMREVVYQPIIKVSNGVYAQRKGNVVKVIIKNEEIEWVEYKYTLKNGRTIKVRVPKGQEPPPKEIYEE